MKTVHLIARLLLVLSGTVAFVSLVLASTFLTKAHRIGECVFNNAWDAGNFLILWITITMLSGCLAGATMEEGK